MTPEEQKAFIMEGVLGHQETCTRAAESAKRMLDVEVGYMSLVVIEETMTSNPIRHEISLTEGEREVFMQALELIAAERVGKLAEVQSLVEKAEKMEWK